MRLLLFTVLLLVSGCDPAAIANFDVRPQPGRLSIDSAFVAGATRLGQDFAQRYQLSSVPRDDCPSGAYFADDIAPGGQVGLNLCLGKMGKEFRFSVVEIITAHWGPKGAALRDELADTLKARYGDAVRVDISRR